MQEMMYYTELVEKKESSSVSFVTTSEIGAVSEAYNNDSINFLSFFFVDELRKASLIPRSI